MEHGPVTKAFELASLLLIVINVHICLLGLGLLPSDEVI